MPAFRYLRLLAAAGAVYAAVVLCAATGALGTYPLAILCRALIAVILAASLNLINGVMGQFSLGHMGFAAVGAYASALVSRSVLPAGGFPALAWALGAGTLAASLAGFLVGFPCLRLRGDYLAVATLGFGEVVRTVLNASPSLGGPRGLPGIPGLAGFGLVFPIAAISLVLLSNLVRSRHGRALKAIRDDEVAAELVGVDTVRYKVMGFMTGAAFAGLAGGLMAHHLRLVHPSQFGFQASAQILVMIHAGGLGSLPGSALAAALLTFALEALRLGTGWLRMEAGLPVGPEWAQALFALLLVLVVHRRPAGILGGAR